MLRQRLLTGVGLALLFSLGLFWSGTGGAIVFFGLCAAMVVAGLGEYFALLRAAGLDGFPRLTTMAAVVWLGLLAVTPQIAPEAWGLAFAVDTAVVGVFLLFGFLLMLARDDRPAAVRGLCVSLGGLVGVFWALSFIPRLYYSAGMEEPGRALTLYLLAVTKLGDVGAYAAGTLTARRRGGNHKVVPTISPKKSWEGCIGGVVASVVASVVLASVLSERLLFGGVPVLGTGSAVVFGVLFAVLGFVGDVAESFIKRAAGVKDSGHLPGLGGVLDVVDSLILVGPLFYAYLMLSAALGRELPLLL